MDDLRLARWRLKTQRLSSQLYSTPVDVVRGMLGFQAENYAQAAWGVASRTLPGVTQTEFDRLFDSGEILRTHVLRPTWHFVLRDDIRWLVKITAPRIRRSLRQLQKSEGISDQELFSAVELICDHLDEDKDLTRVQIGERLAQAGHAGEGMALGLILSWAEAEALICSGAISDGKQTYALLESRAPTGRALQGEEALAELAFLYFRGHGPATERDLAYWATLTIGEVRGGIAAARDQLDSIEHDGRTYWFVPPPPEDTAIAPRAHLLLILDEYYRGYQDSRELLDIAGIRPQGRETAIGMALVDSQMVGSMRRSIKSQKVSFEVHTFRTLAPDESEALHDAAQRYGDFLGLAPELVPE